MQPPTATPVPVPGPSDEEVLMAWLLSLKRSERRELRDWLEKTGRFQYSPRLAAAMDAARQPTTARLPQAKPAFRPVEARAHPGDGWAVDAWREPNQVMPRMDGDAAPAPASTTETKPTPAPAAPRSRTQSISPPQAAPMPMAQPEPEPRPKITSTISLQANGSSPTEVAEPTVPSPAPSQPAKRPPRLKKGSPTTKVQAFEAMQQARRAAETPEPNKPPATSENHKAAEHAGEVWGESPTPESGLSFDEWAAPNTRQQSPPAAKQGPQKYQPPPYHTMVNRTSGWRKFAVACSVLILVGGALVLVHFMTGFSFGGNSSPVDKRLPVTAKPVESRPPDVDRRFGAEGPVVFASLRSFFQAKTPEQKSQQVRGLDAMLPALQKYYQAAPIEQFDDFYIRDLRTQKINGVEFVSGRAILHADRSQVREFAMERIEGRYLLDWKEFVGWSEMTWEDFLSERPENPMAMRLLVQMDSANSSREFPDARYLCLRLQGANSAKVEHAFVPRDSQLGRELHQIVAQANSPRKLRLVTHYEQVSGQAPWLVIDQLADMHWLDPDPTGERAAAAAADSVDDVPTAPIKATIGAPGFISGGN